MAIEGYAQYIVSIETRTLGALTTDASESAQDVSLSSKALCTGSTLVASSSRIKRSATIFARCRRPASLSCRASSDERPMGFSQRTCFPASSALDRPRRVQMIRERVVDGVDGGIGAERVAASVLSRNAQACSHDAGALGLAGCDGHDSVQRSPYARSSMSSANRVHDSRLLRCRFPPRQ
jgi:hypothetical protein